MAPHVGATGTSDPFATTWRDATRGGTSGRRRPSPATCGAACVNTKDVPVIRPMEPEDADRTMALVVAAEMLSLEEADVVRGLLDEFLAGSSENHACLIDEQIVGVAYVQPKGVSNHVWDLTMIAIARAAGSWTRGRPAGPGRGRPPTPRTPAPRRQHLGHGAVRPHAGVHQAPPPDPAAGRSP